MRSKVRNIFLRCSKCKYEMIALMEKWLENDVLNNEVLYGSYHIFRSDRLNTKRGFVLTVEHTSITSGGVPLKSNSDLEFICIWVKLAESDIVYLVILRLLKYGCIFTVLGYSEKFVDFS